MAANRAFDPLYRHISSNNISMTAPVETRYPASTLEASEMGAPNEQGEALVSFLYRSTDIYPSEIAQNIQVEDIAPMTVVSLGLKGSYDYSSYQKNGEISTTTVRNNLHACSQRKKSELGEENGAYIEGCPRNWEELPRPDLPLFCGHGWMILSFLRL